MLPIPEQALGRSPQPTIAFATGPLAALRARPNLSFWAGAPRDARSWYTTGSPQVALVTASSSATESAQRLAPWLCAGPPTTAWGMNPIKGAFTEHAMQRALTSGAFEGTRWATATPYRAGNQGIDGLFFRTDNRANLTSMMVSDAKFGTAKLNQTSSGLQMSRTWTRPRLEQTAHSYDRIASRIESGGCRQTKLHPPSGVKTTDVPWKNGDTIQVWEDHGKFVFRGPDDTIRPQDLVRQIRRTSQWLQGAAEGKVDYRSTLTTVDIVDGKFVIEIKKLDPETAKQVGESVTIKFNERMKAATERSLGKAFREYGFSDQDAKALAKHCSQDPEFLKQMNPKSRLNWRAGISWRAVGVAGIAAGIFFIGSSLLQLLCTGNIDLKKTGFFAVLTAGSTFLGQYAGIQATSLLTVTSAGQRLIALLPLRSLGAARLAGSLGGFAGGFIASILISYLAWGMGWSDLRTANRSLTANLAGLGGFAGIYLGAQMAVAAWGVASTGTAISTLSGAAAANATMAWFGGGAIGAGGIGASWGAVILSGGAAAIAIVLTLSVTGIFRILDIRERRRLVLGRIELVGRRVSQALQPEWHALCAS